MTTVWMDAKVVLRFLTGEPPELAERARRVIRRAERGELALRLTPVTLAEIVFVLEHYYRYPASRIAEVLGGFLAAEGIEIEERDVCREALALAARTNVGFPDAYLASLARSRGEPVCTFDQVFARRLGVETVG